MNVHTATMPLSVQYLKTIGIVNNGFNGRGFTNPIDVAISSDDRIFVLNRCDAPRRAAIRVGICNLDEDYLGEFGEGFGEGDKQFKLPAAMAFDSRDRLHIVDEVSHRVTVFDPSGSFLHKWGVHGAGAGELDGPSGIAFDSDDNCYIADQNNDRVQKFSPEGEPILGWGRSGEGDGEFNMPWGVAVDGRDYVYVADWRNDRVQKFTADGEFVRSFGRPGHGDGELSRPSGVAVDDEGNVYVADWGNERVQVFAEDGRFVHKLRGQATVSKWAEEFFASNPDEVAVRKIANLTPELPPHLSNPYQVSSQTEGYFWGPASVRLDGAGRLYVVETNRHRLQIYERV